MSRRNLTGEILKINGSAGSQSHVPVSSHHPRRRSPRTALLVEEMILAEAGDAAATIAAAASDMSSDLFVVVVRYSAARPATQQAKADQAGAQQRHGRRFRGFHATTALRDLAIHRHTEQ